MRHMEICRKSSMLNKEIRNTLIYYVTVDELYNAHGSIILESYGVGVTIFENGETELVPNVTFSKTGILSLVELLSAHLVTPVTAFDVVSDWLCENP